MSSFISIQSRLGLNKLPVNSCNLLDFQLLCLADGETYAGESYDRELLAVILGGKATFTVGSELFERVGGRADVFSGRPHSIYIPCQTDFTVTANAALEVALVSAPSSLLSAPYVIPPERVVAGSDGAANFSHTWNLILTHEGQPDLPAQRLIVAEAYLPSGNWGIFPPRRHENDDLPREAFLEEIDFFKLNPPDGFALTRHYNNEIDSAYVVRDNTVLMLPNGYHTVVTAPGYITYYLCAFAGNQRVRASAEDPTLAWVSRAVPMLRSQGR